MSVVNMSEVRSEDEVIKILREHNIAVVMRPVALLPDILDSYNMFGHEPAGTVETNIYDALRKLETRSIISRDPFS